MSYDSEIHHRQSHRLRGYDYSFPAPYFVTLCSQNAVCLFGEVEKDQMLLNEAGQMVQDWLAKIPNKFPGVLVDSFQVMPNHLHAILVILGGGLDMAAKFGIGIEISDPLSEADNGIRYVASNRSQTTTTIRDPALGRVVQWFKTMTTNNYIRGVRDPGWKPFPKRLWQRDYFDHIIRNEMMLERTRGYIRDNPIYWAVERERPDRMGEQSFAEWLLANEL